jgi:sterol 3beta-glucosyltransferase
MRVAIVTWGSRGDFQPYLALALAFARAGHDVRLAGWRRDDYAAAAAERGIPYTPLGAGHEQRVIADLARRPDFTFDAFRLLNVIVNDLLLPGLEQMYAECLPLADWADVVIGHSMQPAARMAADKLRRSFVSGTIDPSQVPSRYSPPGVLPNLGPRANRLLWRLLRPAFGGWLAGVNRVRHGAGLAPLRDPFDDGLFAPALNLVAASPRLLATPPDWPPRHVLTGYWFLEQPDYAPPSEVAAFVARMPRPVAIGFGSMPSVDGAALTRLLVDAAERAGVRAVLDPGWAGLGGDLPPTILDAAGVPHAWLFRHVGAVVHHGGAGTTAAAFRAGAPQVIVPHVFDQFYWARLARRLGVAPPPVARRALTPERLARAIRVAVGDSAMRERAARIGKALRGEEGAGTAVRLVEAHAANPRPGLPGSAAESPG